MQGAAVVFSSCKKKTRALRPNGFWGLHGSWALWGFLSSTKFGKGKSCTFFAHICKEYSMQDDSWEKMANWWLCRVICCFQQCHPHYKCTFSGIRVIYTNKSLRRHHQWWPPGRGGLSESILLNKSWSSHNDIVKGRKEMVSLRRYVFVDVAEGSLHCSCTTATYNYSESDLFPFMLQGRRSCLKDS